MPAFDECTEISAAESAQWALPGASLTFRDLAFSVPLPSGEVKTILEPCSGHFEPGQLVALMGPSGCGKSTLLDMLAMKKTAAYTGEVLVNGHVRQAATFPRVAVYVGQEDVMPQHWRVREAVEFNAALKGRATKATGNRDTPVDLLLDAFGLGGVKETYIGGPGVRGISGGQRRRVTLARGVAAQAPLLFCDEPTSGLSATDAELCIRALRTIAKALNILVFVVIHQPRAEVSALFDSLLVLTANPGRLCYMGPMNQAVSYMASCGHPLPECVNATDRFLDLVTPGVRLDCSEHFVRCFGEKLMPRIVAQVVRGKQRRGQTVEEMVLATQGTQGGRHAVSFGTQFAHLLRRKVSLTLRNPLAIGLPVVLPVALGAVVGLMFGHIGDQDLLQQVAFIFIMITVLGLGGMQLMPILIAERQYMKYDTSEALYSEAAAVLASFCVDVPLAFMGAAYEVLLMFALSGMDSAYLHTVFFWAMLVFFVYDALFALVAAVAKDGQQAQALATPILAIFLLCNGFIVTKSGAPSFVKWVFPVCPNAYAMQAIVLELARDAGGVGEIVVKRSGYESGQDLQGVAVLGAMVIVLRGAQLVALKFLHSIKR